MQTYRQTIAQPETIAIIAHRGAWDTAPENSLAAIEAAIAAGATVAEIDLQRTKDGHFVLLHDATTLRTTGTALMPAEVTLAELRALRLLARDGAGGEVTVHTIPTLAEALDCARGRILLDHDLKDRADAPAVIEVLRAADATGFVDLKFAIETAADTARLAALQAETGIAIMAMATFDAATEERLAALLAHPPFMVECRYDSLARLAAVVPRLRQAGVAVWVNTLDVAHSCGHNDTAARQDPEAVWGALLGAGVRAIQTDEPASLAAWLGRRRAAA